ncbi:mitochondrial dicarboxylate carrier-like isoform X1 [Arapaima gigas]
MAEQRVSRWYFGGVASCGAACCTHPLDLIKVHLQTQQEVKLKMTEMAMHVVQREGVLALYSGLSASLCRQISYSLTRFAIYETVRDVWTSRNQGPLPFYQKALLGAFGGAVLMGPSAKVGCEGVLGGLRLTLTRFTYHMITGVTPGPEPVSTEGVRKLFSGASMASSRGAMVTVGQLSCYDQAKQLVLGTGVMSDNMLTHFLASVIAGGCATFLCQPLDVVKTRLMSSNGEYKGVIDCLRDTSRLGPLAFYKGLVPAGIRLVPHTVLTFIFLEQLRKYFGIPVPV